MLLLNVTFTIARIGVPSLLNNLCVMLTAVTRPLKIEFSPQTSLKCRGSCESPL